MQRLEKTHHRLKEDAILLHYKVYSSEQKEWVVFVHGAGGSSTIWYRQIRAYRKHFNVLVVDLRGHGNTSMLAPSFTYTFDLVSQDIMDVLDHERIKKAHFVGVSLGTILIRHLAEKFPDRVVSMVLAGAVMRITPRLNILLKAANLCKYILPYMWLYRFFAWILMPKKAHQTSRLLFVQEAKKIQHREFLRWLKLTSGVTRLLLQFNEKDTGIPTLYIMGEEDYMFLFSVQEIARQQASSDLAIIPDSGHVCNVDQPTRFNKLSIDFIYQIANQKVLEPVGN